MRIIFFGETEGYHHFYKKILHINGQAQYNHLYSEVFTNKIFEKMAILSAMEIRASLLIN